MKTKNYLKRFGAVLLSLLLFGVLQVSAQTYEVVYETNFQGWTENTSTDRVCVLMDNGLNSKKRNIRVTPNLVNTGITNNTDLPTADMNGSIGRGGGTNYLQLPAMTFNNTVRVTVYMAQTSNNSAFQVLYNQEGIVSCTTGDINTGGTLILDAVMNPTNTREVQKFQNTVSLDGTYNICLFNSGGSSSDAVRLMYLKIETEVSAPTVVTDPATTVAAPLDFGTIAQNAQKSEVVKIYGAALTGDLTVVSSNPAAFAISTGTILQALADDYSLGITFNPGENLAVNDYNETITISGGGLATPKVIYVTGSIVAPDVTPPAVSTISPDPAVPEKLPLSGDIVLTFNENVAVGTGTILFNGAAITPSINPMNASVVVFSVDGLTPNTSYSLVIPAGAIVDLAGNAFAGGTYTWTSVTPQPAITGGANGTQSVRQGSAIDPITFSITNASAVSVQNQAALEALGLIVTVSNTQVTISGTLNLSATIGAQAYQIQATPLATANDPVTQATANGQIVVKDINSKNVAYVTLAADVDATNDYIRWELGLHYDVTPINMANVVAYGATPAGSQVELSTYDLIVFQEGPDGAGTNAVAGSYVGRVPVLNMKPHYYNSGRWNLGTGVNGSADRTVTINPSFIDHPIFNGLDVSSGTLTYATGGSGNIIQGASGVSLGDLIASISAGVSIHEIPVGTTMPAGSLGGRTTAEKYLLISLANANRSAVNADGLILFKNACDYLLGLNTTTPIADPIVSFGIKWSTADEIIQPSESGSGIGTITFNSLNTDAFPCIETYVTLASGFEDCVLYIDGEPFPEIGLDQLDVPSFYVCYGADGIQSGDTFLIEVVRTTETIATYSLEIGGISTGLNGADADKELKSANCFTITGVQVPCSSKGIVIKKKTYTDGSTDVVKELK